MVRKPAPAAAAQGTRVAALAASIVTVLMRHPMHDAPGFAEVQYLAHAALVLPGSSSYC